MREEDYAFYLDTRRYGTTPHAGFGPGFWRLVMYLTGMQNIRDVFPFPAPRAARNTKLGFVLKSGGVTRPAAFQTVPYSPDAAPGRRRDLRHGAGASVMTPMACRMTTGDAQQAT